MSTTGMMPARQWAQLLGMALALAVILTLVVAVVLPAAALLMALAFVATGAAFVVRRVGAVARSARSAVAATTSADQAPQPTMRLELPDGQVLSARPVPLPAEREHTMLLTRDGYVVVSAEGRVLHRL